MNCKRILSFILTLILISALFTACSKREDETASARTSAPAVSTAQEEAIFSRDMIGSRTPDFRELVSEKHEINDHTVGWLYVPGAEIEDVVVFYENDNDYYYRRNFERENSFDGVLYADKRSAFGDGSRNAIGINTTIYGHAMTDNSEARRYNVFFGPLHDFRDPELAEKMPYIYFSTEAEQMAFEVFAVFALNADQRDIPYNFEPENQAEFVQMVKEKILPRSKYDYGTELSDTDKFITLSTCIYTLDNGEATNYPNSYYRYAIMGRLVDPKEPRKERADFTINENVIVDPHGRIDSPPPAS